MRIKHDSRKVINIKRTLKKRYFFFVILSIFSISIAYVGAYSYKEKLHLSVQTIMMNFTGTVSNYISSVSNNNKVIEVDIKHKNYLELARQQEESLSNGIGYHKDNKYVRSNITYDGNRYKAKVRVKGTMSDHWDTNKWSFNIKLSNGKIDGMKRFSVMHPKTRGYLHGYVDSKIFEHEGILNARQDFANIVINGKDNGVYIIEEKPRKELLESQGRREGPILLFDKKDLIKEWVNYESDPLHGKDLSRGASSFYAADIKVHYKPKDLTGESVQKKSALLMDKFRRGDIKPSKVFDLDLLWL